MRSPQLFLSLSLASFLVLAGAGCANSAPSSTSTTVLPTPEEEHAAPTNTQGMGMMQPKTPPELTAEQKAQLQAGEETHEAKTLTFQVNGGMFYFTPNMIKVKKGDKVKITFVNDGGTHNFILDEFNVKTKTTNSGETDTMEFTADKAGTFEYYCGVGQHRKMGQKGTLVVTE
jgi:plastocyanin